ncbi:MAG: NAD(P)H-binding protein [Polyangiaceae bacterium]
MTSRNEATVRRVLVAGGSGFVGNALLPELVAAGYTVRATTRDTAKVAPIPGVEWIHCDVAERADLDRALAGIDAAFFLVHGMGSGNGDYAEAEQHTALAFREAAASSGVQRIVFLGGVEPEREPSEHLKSRLRVGQILREGSVPTLELRASMIIGNGSTSWRIVRDLALRLPAMILPSWTDSRTCPIDVEDVRAALLRGLEVELPESAWYDIPGPEVLSAREILTRVASLNGRHVPSVRVPLLSVSLSSWWLKLVTRADFAVARELVLGLSQDLLPANERYWQLIAYRPKFDFETSARRALASERGSDDAGLFARLEEGIVQLVGRILPR